MRAFSAVAFARKVAGHERFASRGGLPAPRTSRRSPIGPNGAPWGQIGPPSKDSDVNPSDKGKANSFMGGGGCIFSWGVTPLAKNTSVYGGVAWGGWPPCKWFCQLHHGIPLNSLRNLRSTGYSYLSALFRGAPSLAKWRVIRKSLAFLFLSFEKSAL